MNRSNLAVFSGVTLLLLAGCGGSGEGTMTSGAAAVSAESSQDTVQVYEPATGAALEPDGNGVVTSAVSETAELVTTPQFDFSTQWEMAIDFDVGQARGKDGFLSICSDYEFDGESSYEVNYDECAVRGSISNGVYNASFNVTNDVKELLGVIWFADPFTPPLFQEFEVSNAQSSISWR